MLWASAGDRAVLLLTFALTVLVDLAMAIEVGVVLASVLFVHRMAEAVALEGGPSLFGDEYEEFDEEDGAAGEFARERLPAGVEIFELRGPLFFGASGRLLDLLEATAHQPPAVFILRMKEVPLVDVSGKRALHDFVRRCASVHTRVIVSELQPGARQTLVRMGRGKGPAGFVVTDTLADALRAAAPDGASSFTPSSSPSGTMQIKASRADL
jgi:SulP family sulfate permease